MPRRLPGRTGPPPAMSIVLAVFDPPHDALITQLDAIAGQTSTDWECIVVDDASTDPEVRRLLVEWTDLADERRLILREENGGIAAATNDGIDAARGTFLTICDHDDVIHPDAVQAFLDHFERHPLDDVAYSDEQLVDADGSVIADYPKPDYSPRRHLGQHYLAHLVAARRSAIGDLRVRREFEPSQDYDFWLRVIERSTVAGRQVGHLPQVLYSWRAIAGSSALDAGEKPEMCDAVRRCSQAALERRGIRRTAETVLHDGSPTTSVRLLFGTEQPEPTIALVEIEPDADPADLNAAVAGSFADVICFVPPDAGVDAGWAAPLAAELTQDDVAAIGPKIVTSQGDLASIGRTIVPTLVDRLAGATADSTGPWGAFFVVREVSVVAPQGLTIRRSTFEAAGGLAEDLDLDLSVADLCRRLSAVEGATLVHPDVVLRCDHVDADRGNEVERGVARIRGSIPDLWVEHFDVLGTSHAAWSEPAPLEHLRDLLVGGRLDLVTSDVFDTVVTRPMATPSDLFVRLTHRLDLPSHVTPQVFASARRDAERRARVAHSTERRHELTIADPGISEADLLRDPRVAAPEVTLDEIWARMPDSWGDPDVMLEVELALESEILQPIPEAIEAFGWARDAGVPVVLVSDIYLTSRQLSGVLAAAGVDMGLIDEVVTSADHRLGKAHGLLARTIEDRGVVADRVAHVGDNEIADFETAQKLGVHPIHVDVAWVHRHVDMPSPSLRTWSSAAGTDLGITAAVRSVLVAAGPHGTDPSFQYGAAVVGPVLAGFARWVASTSHELGASHVHCMLREGATIADLLVATAAPDTDDTVPVPLHVSRWVTMRAAVIDGTADELMVALARRADLTADHVVRAFGCDRDLVVAAFGGERADPDHIAEAYAALADDAVLRAQITAHTAELRARVLIHLRRVLVLDDGPLVVADVGWGGTIQEGLTRILRSDGIEQEVVGLYLALSAPGEERLAGGARMLSYLPNVTDDVDASIHSRSVAHHADTVERIMTPAIGTLIDIDDEGVPVCRPDDHDPIPPTLQSAQRAMRLVVDRLADESIGTSDLTDARWLDPELRASFARVLSDSVTAPGRSLAEALGAWPHDDVAGTSFQSIAGGGLAEAVRHATARDLDLLDPSGRNWVAGIAGIVNPALSAQLVAGQAGAPLDRLVPTSEVGVARLAAFEEGSDLAELQIAREVHVGPNGWSVIRLAGEVGSLRSLRFDAGEASALVEIDLFAVELTTTRTFDVGTVHVDLDHDDLTFLHAHPLDRRRFVQRAGGHLLLGIDPSVAPTVRSIEVTVGFRCWSLGDDESLARTPTARRAADQTRRIASAVRRRL